MKVKIIALIIQILIIYPVFWLQAQDLKQMEAQLDDAWQKGNFKKAIALFPKIQPLYLRNKDKESFVTNYCFNGYAYFSINEPRKMKVYLDSAIYFAHKYNLDSLGEAYSFIWNYSGWYYNEINQLDKSILAFEKSLKIQISNGVDSIDVGMAYQNLGTQLEKKGDLQKSLNHYYLGLQYLPQTHLETANVFNNLALTYQKLKKLESAITNYNKSIFVLDDLVKKEEQRLLRISIYHNLATAYNDSNHPNQAFSFLKKIKYLIKPNENKLLAKYHYVLAYTYLQIGNILEAKKHYKQALVIRTKVLPRNHSDIANSHRELAQLYAKQSQYTKALSHYQKALSILSLEFNDRINVKNNPSLQSTVSDRIELFKTLHYKAQSLKAIQNLEAAKNTYLLALDLADELRQDYQAEGSKFALLNKTINIFEEAIAVAVALKDTNLAFHLMERSKSALLLEGIKNAEAKEFANIPTELLEKEKELSVAIAFKERTLAQAHINKEEAESKKLNQTLFQLRRDYQTLIENLESNFPEYYQLKYAQQYATIPEVQAFLPNDQTALIEYFVGDSSIYVMFISKKEQTLLALPKNDNFDETIDKLQTSLNSPQDNIQNFELFARASFALSQAVFEPIKTKLNRYIKELVIIPDGRLGYIPFQILLKHPIDTNELIEARFDTLSYYAKDYIFSYANSSTLLTQKQALTRIEQPIIFGGFAPVFDQQEVASIRGGTLGKLAYSAEEISTLNELLDGSTYLKEKATRTNFFEQAPNFKILHLSTHASAAEEAIQTKIHFYDDYLTIKDIYNIPINADLTVLSACETGLGKLQKGEGVISLARAFRYAGCPSLVTSLWQVEDKKTSGLMIDFYKQLKKGKAKNVALHQAQMNYLANITDSQSAHPFYWAGFIQTGSTQAIFNNFDWLYKIGLGVVASLFLFLVLFQIRKKSLANQR